MIKRILVWSIKEDVELLKSICVKVTAFDDILKGWAQDLIATTKANHCYGVAAPQIGISIRMICINYREDGELMIMVNPEIIEATGRMKYEELCLSFPGLVVKTKRKSFVRVRYQDTDAIEHEYVTSGVEAICIQHEIDHLNGKLLSDHGALYKAK